jgi:hypothetical protein
MDAHRVYILPKKGSRHAILNNEKPQHSCQSHENNELDYQPDSTTLSPIDSITLPAGDEICLQSFNSNDTTHCNHVTEEDITPSEVSEMPARGVFLHLIVTEKLLLCKKQLILDLKDLKTDFDVFVAIRTTYHQHRSVWVRLLFQTDLRLVKVIMLPRPHECNCY